jgi:hypothetical protein
VNTVAEFRQLVASDASGNRPFATAPADARKPIEIRLN